MSISNRRRRRGVQVAAGPPLVPGNLIPTMTTDTAPSGEASASGSYSGAYLAWKAFNHASGLWQMTGEVGWLQYQFPEAHIVTQYTIYPDYYAAGTWPPKTWTFKGSNNGTDWTTLDTQTNVSGWGTPPNTLKVFPFANTTSYTYYRLDITAGLDNAYVGVGELEMMEVQG